MTGPKKTRPAAREPSATVSFRVDARTYRRLEADAEELSLSPGEYARKLVRDALEDRVRTRLLDTTEETREAVIRLRSDVATALEMILLNLTQAEKEQIRQWVTDHLRR